MPVTIRRKIAFLVFIPLTGIVVLAAMLRHEIGVVYDAANFVTINTVPSVREIDAAADAIATFRSMIWPYVLSTTPAGGAAKKERLDQALQAAADAMTKYEKEDMDESPEVYTLDKAQLDETRAALADLVVMKGKIDLLVGSGQATKAQALLLADLNLLERLDRSIAWHRQLNIEFGAAAQTVAERTKNNAAAIALWLAAALVATVSVLVYLIARSIETPTLRALSVAEALTAGAADKIRAVEAIAAGDLGQDISLSEVPEIDPLSVSRDETGTLLKAIVRMSEVQRSLDTALRAMTLSLRVGRDADNARDWLKTGFNELNDVMRGEQSSVDMAAAVLSYLAQRAHAGVGTFFLFDTEMQELVLIAGFAVGDVGLQATRLRLGQGLPGQCAQERKTVLLHDVPEDYLRIGSGIGNAKPREIIVLPLVHAGNLIGVIELGSFSAYGAMERNFLEQVSEGIAVSFGTSQSRQRMAALLARTVEQSEELRAQQEELQASNEELEERAEILESQREEIRRKNAELERAANNKTSFFAKMAP